MLARKDKVSNIQTSDLYSDSSVIRSCDAVGWAKSSLAGKGATLPAVTPNCSTPRMMKLIVPSAE